MDQKARKDQTPTPPRIARIRRAAGDSPLERKFAEKWQSLSAPAFVTQHKFHPSRRWKFDFAWPLVRVAAEIHGATFAGGRHVNGLGYWGDRIKINAAQRLNWKVFELVAQDVEDQRVLGEILCEIETRSVEGIIFRNGSPFAEIFAESKRARLERTAA